MMNTHMHLAEINLARHGAASGDPRHFGRGQGYRIGGAQRAALGNTLSKVRHNKTRAGAFIPAAGHVKACKIFGDSTNSLAQRSPCLDTENRAAFAVLSQIERIE